MNIRGIIVVLLAMLVLMSSVAFAQDDQGNSDDSGQMEESDGTGDTDQELEDELDELEGTTDEEEEELLEELEGEVETTDEELLDGSGVDDQDEDVLDDVEDSIGRRQFVLNLQLKHRLRGAVVAMQTTITYMEAKGYETSDLQTILDEITNIADGLNETDLDKDGFAENVREIQSLVKRFHDNVHETLSSEELRELRQLIAGDQNSDESFGQLKKREAALRHFHNQKEQQRIMRQVVREAREIKQSAGRILNLTDRLRELRRLHNAMANMADDEVDQLRDRWREQLSQYDKETDQAPVNARRLELVKDAIQLRKEIRDAKAEGKDTADLENDYAAARDQVKDTRSLRVMDANTRARLDAAKDRLAQVRAKTAERARAVAAARDAATDQRRAAADAAGGDA